jgi:CRP-like cAMP-binding protein
MGTEALLACVEPFAGAGAARLTALASAAARTRKPGHAPVLREGRAPDGLYVVLRGRVNLVRQVPAGREIILCSLGPGDVFGEGAAFDGMLASTRAVTAVPTELLHIPAEPLRAFVHAHPPTLARLVAVIGERLAEVESVASGLALLDVEERLRRTLGRLARRQGRHSPAAPGQAAGWILAPVPTQSELARMVGSCRETVSRTLGVMARHGLVSGSGRRMVVHETLVAEPPAAPE